MGVNKPVIISKYELDKCYAHPKFEELKVDQILYYYGDSVFGFCKITNLENKWGGMNNVVFVKLLHNEILSGQTEIRRLYILKYENKKIAEEI